MILAVDVGYGYTKYAYREQVGKFPSAVAYVPAITGFGERSVYIYSDSYYLVGENAMWSDTISTRTDDFLLNYSPLLVYHLLKKEGIRDVGTLCLSLSIAEYRHKKDKLESICKNFVVNKEEFTQRVIVFPQGVGIWVDVGRPDNALIVDAGFNTLDVLTVLDSRPRPEYSFSFSNSGVGIIVDAIKGWFNSNFPGTSLSPVMADRIIMNKGKFTFYRKEYDISSFLKKQEKFFAEKILSAVLSESRLKDVLSFIDNFVIAGGGAYFVPGEVAEKYMFSIPEKPEFSNVRGFLRAAGEIGGE